MIAIIKAGKTMDLNFFNPQSQKEQDFLANFVARQTTLAFFLQQLRLTGSTQAARHLLVVAPRGYGKTSLLRRISIAVRNEAEFKERFIALTFREEQHNVISLDVFWRNCLEALQEAREDEGADNTELGQLEALWLQHSPRNTLKREEQDGEPAWQAFNYYCQKLCRRPILLIDNLDSLLGGLADQHQWALRRILQRDDGPFLMAAASRYPDSTHDTKAAFFEFFRIQTLDRLSDSEVMQCLRTLASHRAERGKKVIELLNTDPGRISALNTLAGGNPRTLNVLYSVLEADMSADILSQLSAMLDTFTGWYQARTEELPMQTRAVFDALALNWDPMTAANLGLATGLDTPTVSSQLSRLEKLGYAETVSLSSKKKGRNGYQVSERFYNIWYLMRNGPRRARQTIKFLTAFLQSCFSTAERRAMARDTLRDDCREPAYVLALASSFRHSQLRSALINHVQKNGLDESRSDEYLSLANELLSASRVSRRNLGNVEKTTLQVVLQAFELQDAGDYLNAEKAYKKALKELPRELYLLVNFGAFLLYDLHKLSEAEEIYKRAIEIDSTDAQLHNSLAHLLSHFPDRVEETETAYRRATYLEPKNTQFWAELGAFLQDKVEKYAEAEVACRTAIEIDPKNPSGWNNLGNLLHNHLKRYEEAESLYRKAINLDKSIAWTWCRLGDLYQDHMDKFDEAEFAYRKALKIDSKDADTWAAFATLLQRHLSKYDEAENASRKAIELDPNSALGWITLASLLDNYQKRYDEAEVAYCKAIDLRPKSAWLWTELGQMLMHPLGRFEEALAAFQAAIKIAPSYSHTWERMGHVMGSHLGQYEEAEQAYKRCIELEPDNSFVWRCYGELLHSHMNRYEEAEAAYRKSIVLNGNDGTSHLLLAKLLTRKTNRFDEAATEYRMAIRLDKKNHALWNSLGNVLLDKLGDLSGALLAYQQGLLIDKESSYLNANCAYVFALHLKDFKAADTHYGRFLTNGSEESLSAAGAILIEALPFEVEPLDVTSLRIWQQIDKAITSKGDSLWADCLDDLQRLLWFVISNGHGEAFKLRMEEALYPTRFAPFYHAVVAAMEGEDHLLSTNPETRQPALHLYDGLVRRLRLYPPKPFKKKS
ncbi:MAG: tetratricopeptide repeat protein [Polaromonas sp.]|nr:tetratricopeptide repeat protein [Polaromonas sp.]